MPHDGIAEGALPCACLWHKNCSLASRARFPRSVERRGIRLAESNQARTAFQVVGEERDVQQIA